MAVPKRKKSKSKRDTRRTHDRARMTENKAHCPQCHEPLLSHHICPECGFYRGRSIVKKEAE